MQTKDPTHSILSEEMNSLSDAQQILHLKRLLVTLKQKSEKEITEIQNQLISEKKLNQSLDYQLSQSNLKLKELQINHDEELDALRDQFIALRNLLQQTQEELRLQNDQDICTVHPKQHTEVNQPRLKGGKQAGLSETQQLSEELNQARLKIQNLEEMKAKLEQDSKIEIQRLNELLSKQEIIEDQTEMIASQTSSYQLRLELEEIKQTLKQGHYDVAALENRYIQMLNEKINLEHQIKQLQIQLETQSSNIEALQGQVEELTRVKKVLEENLKQKETAIAEAIGQQNHLKERLSQQESIFQEKTFIQEKYEQLKDEWNQLNESLEEALEIRVKSEQEVMRFSEILNEKKQHLLEKDNQIQQLLKVTEMKEAHLQEMSHLVNESESRFKIAQQHLAKKVKESAILSEKLENQQKGLEEAIQNAENFKNQINQLQANLELYQKQEKKLQDQLHDALKGTESQVSKWEEKYFRMYDKWQDSENRIKELKKVEEKHQQMQNLIANLGNFMGGTAPSSSQFLHTMQELVDKSNQQKTQEEDISIPQKISDDDEKYDLFGMKFTKDKSPPSSHE
jgi:chromosome segregation ATPase